MRKISAILTLVALATMSLRATILLRDSTNYPYTNGTIEGQGQWYCYSPSTPALDALVTNNVLILNTTNKDSVGTPTNGWVNPEELNFASFTINVSQLPGSPNGGYFCEFQDQNDAHNCCHIFIDTRDTTVPGTFRLGVANYATSFSALTPPANYPEDLSTGVTYTVVMAFDTNQANVDFVGATLWINPTEQDYQNAANSGGYPGTGFVFGSDTTASTALQNIGITQIGFSPYADAGISNLIVANTFDEVNTTNLPVFGIQPQSGNYYSGNSATFYAVASGADETYQWYSGTTGALTDDGVNVVGSTSNTLTINNLSVSDTYYAVVTDAYSNTVTSATAVSTVNTTPTAPFFASSVTAENLTNNLFTSTGFTNTALGTGPLYYQWYFAPSNSLTFSPLAGQNNAALDLTLLDYSFQGSYFVVASNSISGGSVAYGPTNTITEIAPINASLLQLHNLMISQLPQIVLNKSGTVFINSNNVTVSGYVTTYGGFGSSSYTEYYIQDTNGYGIQVFLFGFGNTNTPPVGSYVTVSGPVEVYHTGLEIAPTSPSAITTNVAPVFALTPKLANASFIDLSTNGLGTNAILTGGSLVTLTNVYVYGNSSGTPLATNATFYPNGYTTAYFTIGQYSTNTGNIKSVEIYQFGYNHGTNISQFTGQLIPTNCYQLTGVYETYNGNPEIVPSRLQDYVTVAPSPILASVSQAKRVPTITWPPQTGSTYSVLTATNLSGPWTQAAYGLSYYPTNGTFSDANPGSRKFYQITTP